jgi:1-phosphofructokinase family hexose kinase
MFVTVTLCPAIDETWTLADPIALDQVHRVAGTVRVPGGKGINVAKALAASGLRVRAGAIVGKEQAAFFDRALRNMGIEPQLFLVDAPTRTNVMVIGAKGHELKLNHVGYPDLTLDWPSLATYCRNLVGENAVVVLSGSLPPKFPADTFGRLVRTLRSGRNTVVLDTSPPGLGPGVEALPLVIKPNRREFESLVGRPLEDDESVVSALKEWTHSIELVIVSDGERGAWFADEDGVLFASAPSVDAVDSTGAGDFLLGQFCGEFFPSRRLSDEVVCRAVAAGSASTEVEGSVAPSPERVRELQEKVVVTRF